MCGIAGVIARSPGLANEALTLAVAAQRHRGPDDGGQDCFRLPNDRWLGLGQRRLSIIDLSVAGHQPMAHPGTGDVLIYNGEIYNFHELRAELLSQGEAFRGHSDTEVLLHALTRHGPKALDRLAGMFAFAFYRQADHTLLLARDPLGIKPLYVGEGPDGLVFASEVRAIRATGLVDHRVDERSLGGLLAHGSVPDPLTICRGVRSFPAGAYVEIPLGRTTQLPWEKIHRYWQMPLPEHKVSVGRAVAEVSETLDLAVRQHLIADVPVGVFLSSGLDSTVLAGIAAQYTPRLRTFTVGFADEPDLSEAGLARKTARELGIEHTEIQITGPDALAATRQWLSDLDQPSLDGLNTYIISKATREHGIVVALSGLGGDELFGGYSSFSEVPRFKRLLERVEWIPPSVRAKMLSLAGRVQSRASADKSAAMGRSGGDLLQLCMQRRRVAPDWMLTDLGLDPRQLGLHSSFIPPEALDHVRILEEDAIWTVSELESLFYMSNTLLRDSDANSMAHSLEVRVPLLDRRLLDLAYSLPGRVRMPRGIADKHLLRVAFGRFLRPELLEQKKRGFTLPVRRWMQGPLRDLCEESIQYLKFSGLLRPQGVDRVWQAFLAAPETTAWSRAFTLVVLGVYAQQSASRPVAAA